MNTLAFAGLPGGTEVFLILFVILLLFGAKKLPELSRALGRSLSEFKKGKDDLEREIREVKDDIRDGVREESTSTAEEDEPAAPNRS